MTSNRLPGGLGFVSLLAFGLLAAPSHLSAATITGVTIHDVSSVEGPRLAENVINGLGLNTDGTHSQTIGHGWDASSAHPLPQHITFNLGGNYNLAGFHLWNLNFRDPGFTYEATGARDVEILVASDVAGPFTSLGTFEFPMADGTPGYLGFDSNDIGFPGANDVRLVQFSINSSWRGDSPPYSEVGFDEVRFDDGEADPDPDPDPPGEIITGVTIHDVSSEIGPRLAENVINGLGLNTDGTHSQTIGDGWDADPGAQTLPQHITFNLGGNYNLAGFHLWNLNFRDPGFTYEATGARDVEILVASDVAGPFTSLGTFEFPMADGTPGYLGFDSNDIGFPGANDVRLVQFSINSSWRSDSPPYSEVGFDEVRFFSGPSSINLSVAASDSNLIFTWDSAEGLLYNLLSDPGLATDPAGWPVWDGHQDIEATTPENTLTISRPADPERFFVVEVFAAPPQTVLSENFESGQGGWTTGGDPGADPFTNWELGAPSNVGPAAANSPTNCFATNLSANYAYEADIWLRSPAIDLTAAAGATLKFSHYVDIEETFDFGQIRLLDADAANAELAILVMTIDGNNPTGWKPFRRALPAAALGKNVVIEFRFECDDFQNQAGWYIDDIQVTVP